MECYFNLQDFLSMLLGSEMIFDVYMVLYDVSGFVLWYECVSLPQEYIPSNYFI